MTPPGNPHHRKESLLLRAPPFPGARRHAARFSRAVASDDDERPLTDAERQRAAALRDMLNDGRVGGDFWSPIVATPPAPFIVLAPKDRATAAAMLSRAGDDRPAIMVLPSSGWSPAIARQATSLGLSTHIGPADPWSLVADAAELHGKGNADLWHIAAIAGVKRITSDGRETWDDADALVHRRSIATARYRDCFAGDEISAEEAVRQLTEWRRLIDANRPIVAACGISLWKRPEIRSFCWAGSGTRPKFLSDARAAIRAAAATKGDIAAWPSRVSPAIFAEAGTAHVTVRQIEDGFIRSAGLGSDLRPPFSIAIDRRGIYYDPAAPSDLEHLLSTADFDNQLIDRARRLIALVTDRAITKYGTGAKHGTGNVDGLDLPRHTRIILVPGQVEDDRSVRLGGGAVTGNLDLLRRARAAEPEAHILFKPHPDVVAGHRSGHVPPRDAARFADQIIERVPMPALLAAVDAVHVWTSLTGFEALMRGRDVIVHGAPFFAGWGLTRDLGPAIARRTRRLTLEQLVAGALILYPRYLDPVTRLPCQVETLIARLSSAQTGRRSALTLLRQLQGRARARLSAWS